MQTIFYARVSTSEQTLDHQVKQAEAQGFKFDAVVSDNGVSGVSTKLRERPEGKRLFDILRKGDVLVVRWIDRLGRNYADVTDTLRELLRKGVVVRTIINGMEFDGATKDPMKQAVRDALIAFMAASAQSQAEATKEAQRAGIDHAKAQEPTKFLGRKPSYDRKQLDVILKWLDAGEPVSSVAKAAGVSRQTVYRVQEDKAGAFKALEVWGM